MSARKGCYITEQSTTFQHGYSGAGSVVFLTGICNASCAGFMEAVIWQLASSHHVKLMFNPITKPFAASVGGRVVCEFEGGESQTFEWGQREVTALSRGYKPPDF